MILQRRRFPTGCGAGSCAAAPEHGIGKQRLQGKTNYISSSKNQAGMFLKGGVFCFFFLRTPTFFLPALPHGVSKL